MALLKNNTYVDGNLIVADSLYVNTLRDTTGKHFPYLANGTQDDTNSIVIFSSNDGALTPSSLKLSNGTLRAPSLNVSLGGSNTPTIELTSNEITINQTVNKVWVKDRGLVFDEINKTWSYS